MSHPALSLTPEVLAAIRVVAESGVDLEIVREMSQEHVARMSVARDLAAAADRLQKLLDAYFADDDVNHRGTWHGWMTDGLGGAIGDLGAVMGPDFVLAVIRLLNKEADYAAGELRAGVSPDEL